MKAERLLDRRIVFGERRWAALVIWRVPAPLPGSKHVYKYRFAYVVNEICVLRYDNEAGKGDHKHVGERELSFEFVDPQKLLDDFLGDIARWDDEHGYL